MSERARHLRPALRLAAAMIIGLCGMQGMAAETPELPDPTRPPTLHQSALRRLDRGSLQKFSVSAIKIGAERRWALINGRLVAEGERVGEALVIEIRPEAVVLDYLSERIRVALVPRAIRRPVAGS